MPARTGSSTATPARRPSSARSRWLAITRAASRRSRSSAHSTTHMGALSLTGSKPQQKRRFSPLVPGVTHVRYPTFIVAARRPQEEEAFSLAAHATSRRSCSRPFFRPRRWPRSSSSRFRRGRIRRGAGQFSARTAGHLRPARHFIGFGRGSIGLRKDRQVVAIEHSGVEPDIVCLAKGIASGMPLGIA